MSSPFHEGENPPPQVLGVVQVDPKCLHSALKEFFEPLRTNDSRTDFFATYRKESEEFDRDYARKYDEDLNTSLIFAGLFSAVSSAFIVDVQSNLQPDPNNMTAAYMRILIHAVNGSLFPDANPDSIAWTGPPPEIVTVQSLLYASLVTSLFAAFLAMLGKQWVNRYLRNQGGSAADKSRDRQWKLDGLKKWHFQLAIESLPVMLQLALLLLGCALSRYLWTISRTIAAVIIAVTLFGVTLYVFLTLAATLYYNCPYQTPPSILTRAVIKSITYGDTAFARLLRSLITSFPSIGNLARVLGRLRFGARGVLKDHGCVSAVAGEAGHISLPLPASPTQIFGDISINWEVCKADANCIFWILDSTTDTDVIFSTVRFAADTIWYPEIVGALSPHILADLFFDCLLDGQVVPGKSEHASSIGMALASVLSIHLSIEPENGVLMGICNRIIDDVGYAPSSEPTLFWVVFILKFIAVTPAGTEEFDISQAIPYNLPTPHKLWLSRVILQTVWRWRCTQNPIKDNVLDFSGIGSICQSFTADNDHTPAILKTTCFLIMAISLGLQVDIHDLYLPDNNDALQTATDIFFQRLQTCIIERGAAHHVLISILSASIHLNPFKLTNDGEPGISLIVTILNSRYPDEHRYLMASEVVRLLGRWLDPNDPSPTDHVPHTWIPTLVDFLSLCEKFNDTESPPYPGSIALYMLSTTRPEYPCSDTTILPILTSTLLPTHPLQSRSMALEVLCNFMPIWSSWAEADVPPVDLDKLLRAVGDPFQFVPEGQSVDEDTYVPVVILIKFASSDLWRNHLHRSNLTSCEEIFSTEEGRRAALKCMLDTATLRWFNFLPTPAETTVAIRRLEELQCLNTAEVVMLWAWTAGVVDPVDHGAWSLIGEETVRFYQTHGIGRLTSLSRHITDTTMHNGSIRLSYGDSACGSSGFPIFLPRVDNDHCVSRVCQLRRLYHLFGYDPTTWKEAVAVGEVEGESRGVSSGRSVPQVRVTPAQTVNWACDYP